MWKYLVGAMCTIRWSPDLTSLGYVAARHGAEGNVSDPNDFDLAAKQEFGSKGDETP